MDEYIECRQCGFVVLASGGANPQPKRVDSCPACDSTDFCLPGDADPVAAD